MKILFVNTNIGYGGASKMMAFVANTLASCHDVTILVFRDSEVKQELYDSVKISYNTLYKNKIKPIELIGQIIALHRVIKKGEYDLVIGFLHPSHFMIVLSSIMTKAKVLLSERGDPKSRWKNGGLYIHTVERIIRHADAYVFQSDGAAEAYPTKCRKRSKIIVNAIPKHNYPKYNPSEEKYVICVARLELIQKRQDVLLQAFKEFIRTFPDYYLYIVGNGPDESKIKDMARFLGINDQVVFLGERNDVYELMAKAQFLVLSSDYEGIPNVLLEASAIGLPSISTDCSPGGARMVIDNGVNGFLVQCSNPEELAGKMITLAESTNLRYEFSKKMLQTAAKFDSECVAIEWLNFVHEQEH